MALRRRRRPVSRLRQAGRSVRRFTFVFVFGAALVLIGLNIHDASWSRGVRTVIDDAVGPVVDVVAIPFRAADRWLGCSAGPERDQSASLESLKKRIVELSLARREAERLAAENARLRALLNARPRTTGRHIGARVISDPTGPYVRTYLIDVGQKHGVRRGMAVVDTAGLVGRVVHVGKHTARILAITDLNSRIPVKLQRTDDRAILAGTNTTRPRLAFVRRRTVVLAGDRVITSGHGGVLPPGLLVGWVVRVEGRMKTVRTAVTWSRLTHVWVVDYEAPGLVVKPDDALAVDGRRGRGRSGTTSRR
jgi:rod shape-determining protein MreC